MSSGIVDIYTTPPTGFQHLQELEESCEERLRLYRVLTDIKNEDVDIDIDVYDTKVANCLQELRLHRSLRLVRPSLCPPDPSKSDEILTEEALLYDKISHFMLRFYFSRTDELRNFFVSLETRWLGIRWRSALAAHGASYVLDKSGLHPKKLSLEEDQLIRPLVPPEPPVTGHPPNDEDVIYCVNFIEIPTLLEQRRCYLKEGKAYFRSSNLLHYVGYAMKKPLLCQLIKVAPQCAEEDLDLRVIHLMEVLKPLLDAVVSTGLVDYYSSDNGLVRKKILGRSVKAEELDELVSNRHFPPCMATLHTALRTNHHLRYFSRKQYGLFLKDLGLPYTEAADFWKEEFTKKMDEKKYHSEHHYKWRHMYGLVGSHIDERSHDCKQIIEQTTTPLDINGCPFRHYDAAPLNEFLQQQNVSSADAQAIIELSSEGKYQKACVRHFRATHGGKHSLPNDTIEHPLQWVKKSKELDLLNVPDIEDIYPGQGCSGCSKQEHQPTCEECLTTTSAK